MSMRNLARIIFCAAIVFGTTACGDLLKSLRQESLEADNGAEERDRSTDERERERDTEHYKPRRLAGLSANNTPAMETGVKREYVAPRSLHSLSDNARGPAEESAEDVGRRFTRADFVDSNPNENSLWDGTGQTNYLFAQNRKKELGDLVTVEVDRDLRRDILYSLWMTLPPSQRRPKKKEREPASTDPAKPGQAVAAAAAKTEEAAKSGIEKGKDAAEEAAKTNMAAGAADDLMRMEVTEHLGNGIVKAVGEKRVVYKGQARVLEVMALLHAKDIDDSGRVKSTAFIDSKTQVIQ